MSNNLGTMNNQFNFLLPDDFVHPDVEERYLKLLKANRKLHMSVIDYVNSNIVSITYPSMEFPITSNSQITKRKIIDWKTVGNVYDLFDKNFTITCRNVDSNINYKIMQDCLIFLYLDTSRAYDHDIQVEVLDENRRNIFTDVYRNVMFTGISENVYAFNEQALQNKTFTVTFRCNYVDIKYPVDGTDIIPKNILA